MIHIPENRRVLIEGNWVWKCEKCGEPELTQGLCFDHCIVCPKCNENPCNGSVDDPECNVCIEAYRPDFYWNEA